MATTSEALAIGLQHHRRGQLQLAEQIYRQIIAVEPNHADAIHLLGVVARQMGKYEVAVETIGRAIRLNGNVAAYHNNLGNALKDQGKLDEAAACYRRALELKSEYAEAHNNLAAVFKEQGKLDEAVAGYRRALKLKPDYAEAHNNLANALRDQEKPQEAVAGYRRALELKPDYTEAYNHLGSLWKLQERYAEARETYENALRSNPGRDLLRLSIAAICPAIFESSAAIDEYRAALLAQVEDLAQGKFNVEVSQLAGSGAEPPFNLLYHGRDDRPIKEAWARLFRNLPMQERVRAGSSPRPKLGMVVTQSHEGIFLRWCTELLRRMQPKGWEIVVVCSRAGERQVRTTLGGIQLLPVCGSLDQIANTVREARFDVLCHWETGTDSVNYFLPYFRLAPVQCNLSGIQATSGIPQMDYYLSSEFVEAEGAEAHYSEKLLLARGLLGYHIRPSLPATVKPREAFGFRAEQHLYVCPQNLRKFHPDFDPLLAGILQADPAGVVVIMEDHGACVTPMLRRRFAKTLAEVLDRVVFLPHQSYADYLCLVSAADVILDPLYYSGGTTTLEAFSLGKAIVTWPSQFQIGRGVLASYRKMGIGGFVAADAAKYVRMAVALGTDAERRRAAADEILAANGELFEDLGAVREYRRIFDRLVEEARGGQRSQAGSGAWHSPK
jgi:predicted O-linked N-acetylglucosamine transferase (SPINDLY family)